MKMVIEKSLICPMCNSKNFQMKCQATYVYTYEINSNQDDSFIDQPEALPYLFHSRERVDEKEYVICKNCGSSYPCIYDKNKNIVKLTILQKAIRSDYQQNPEFFG